MKRVSAYIFDFDGVLANSMPAHIAAWQKAYETLTSLELVNPERFSGLSTVEIGNILAQECLKLERQLFATDFIEMKQQHLKNLSNTIGLFENIPQILGHLFNFGISFGICSNAPSNYIRRVLKLNSVSCREIVGLGDTKHPKPDPSPYILSAKNLGYTADTVDFSSIVILEDSSHGLSAGVKAGMTAIGIFGDETSTSKISLVEAGASEVYSSASEAFNNSVYFENVRSRLSSSS